MGEEGEMIDEGEWGGEGGLRGRGKTNGEGRRVRGQRSPEACEDGNK